MSQLITGISFPIRFDASGHLARSAGSVKLLDNLKMLITTTLQSRVMRPRYGADIEQHLFKKIDSVDATLIQQDIFQAVSLYEPRIELESVKVSNTDETTINIMVSYKVKGLGYQPTYKTTFTL